MSHRPLALALLILGTWCAAAPLAAAEIDHVREYRDCMALATTDPDAASEKALSWIAFGGGEAARHCDAHARIGLKQYAVAATRLEELAQTTRRGRAFRARYLAQAAQTWRLAGDDAGARADWLALLDRAPNSAAAQAARNNLERLDVKKP